MQELSQKDIESIMMALEMANRNYTRCCEYFLNGDKPHPLGDKTKRVCRFCGRSKENGATFKKKAHALSNLIGNRLLFSYYECDECNQKFSYYENDLAEYLRPYHVILNVSGKNGVPKYKQQESRISNENGTIKVDIFEGDPSIKLSIDEEKKSMTITCRRSYTPINVYKALLKMALTILPEEDIIHFGNTIRFLNSNHAVAKASLPVLSQLYGGGYDVYRFITATIFKRKNDAPDNVPAYMFILAYNNFCFQMPLIGCDLDNHFDDGQKLQMPIVPTPPTFEGYKIIGCAPVDLSSNERVKNEDVPITMRFESMTETNLINTAEGETNPAEK